MGVAVVLFVSATAATSTLPEDAPFMESAMRPTATEPSCVAKVLLAQIL